MSKTNNSLPRWSKRNRDENWRPRQPTGGAHRKAMARLGARINDYARMMEDQSDRTGRKGQGGYHKPGSMKVYG